MPAFTRKLADGLYGGHQPGNVALAVALGVLTGALTGGNVSWTVVLLAAIVFNVHTRLFLAAWSVSLLSSWLAQDHIAHAGRYLLDSTPLGQAVGQLGDSAFLALLGWDQYVVVGGAAVGTAVALCLYIVFYYVTARLNRRWQVPLQVTGDEGGPPDGPRPVGPALACVWYGPTSYERTLRRQTERRRLRRCGVPTALAASLAMGAIAWSLAASYAQREFWRQFSVYNGAEVAAEAAEFSLWTGRFVVHDLRLNNPQTPERDRVRVAVAKGVLSPGLLLRGHLQIDKLMLERISLGGGRQNTVDDQRTSVETSWRSERGGAWARSDTLLVHDELRHWPTICRQLNSFTRVLLAVEQLSRAEQAITAKLPDRDSQCRSDLGMPRPWVAVRQLRITDLPASWDLGRKSMIELNSLSSNPLLSEHAVELKVVVPKFGAEIELAFGAAQAGTMHALRATAYEVPLSQLIDGAHAGRTLSVREGHARLSAQGVCDSQRLEARVQIDVESLAADVVGNEQLAGIALETWQDGLSRLGSFHAELALAGSWASPSLMIDRDQLVDGFRRQLNSAGAGDVVEAIDLQLAVNELPTAQTFVVQASANEATVIANPPGFCDFSEDAEPEIPAERDAEIASSEAANAIAGSTAPAWQPYPTTSLDQSVNVAGGIAKPTPPAAPTMRRQLPGPVNMDVGRDASCLVTTSLDHRAGLFGGAHAPRENVFSRWSRGLREKFAHPVAGAAPSDDDYIPAEDAPPPRQPISAAASEAWYHRLLR